MKVKSIRSYALYAFPAGAEYRLPAEAEAARHNMREPVPAGFEVQAYHEDGESYRVPVAEGSTARLARAGDPYFCAVWEIMPPAQPAV